MNREFLQEMGFTTEQIDAAYVATNNAGAQEAMDWLIAQQEADASGIASAAVPLEDGEINQTQQTAQSLKCDDCGKHFRDATAAERHATLKNHTNFSESTESIKPLTAEEKEEKLRMLKQLMAEKRALREAREKEEEKDREKMRRISGREISEAKEKQREKDLLKALEEKKREREEEKRAKQRVREQIEQDKRDRLAKFASSKSATTATTSAAAAPPPPYSELPAINKDYQEARLQIRVGPGSRHFTMTLPADEKFAKVRERVLQELEPRVVKISTTFPRKVITEAEDGKTLKELDLVPSATLVAI